MTTTSASGTMSDAIGRGRKTTPASVTAIPTIMTLSAIARRFHRGRRFADLLNEITAATSNATETNSAIDCPVDRRLRESNVRETGDSAIYEAESSGVALCGAGLP